MKRASRDEVPLDEFDQVLNRSFLVPRSRSTRLWMKFELHGELLVGRIPDRLGPGGSTPHPRFYIFPCHHPPHTTKLWKTSDPAPAEGPLPPIGVETHPHCSATVP